jgi:hypothetical protein
MTLDGRPIPAAPLADATAPAWPGAHGGTGVGGSGSEPAAALYGAVSPLPPPPPSKQSGATQLPSAPTPSTPAPANTAPANPLPGSPPPANAAPGAPMPATPAPSSDAPLLPPSPAPASGSPALPLPATPTPANAAPALPLPSAPAPTPGPAQGKSNVPAPTWFPSSLPPSPVPDAPQPEITGTRFARADTKIDPSGQAHTVLVRVHLRARTLDLSRNARISLADRG